MDVYVSELDDTNRIAAIWVKKNGSRGPSVFDPRKHLFEPRETDRFDGAPREDIVTWLSVKQQSYE